MGSLHASGYSPVAKDSNNSTQTGFGPRPSGFLNAATIPSLEAKKQISVFKRNSNENEEKSTAVVVAAASSSIKAIPANTTGPVTLFSQNSTNPIQEGSASQNIQVNPYTELLDYSDLDVYFTDSSAVHTAINTVLLRHNSSLIAWFRECATRYDNHISEVAFTMDLSQIWRLVREIKVLGNTVTLASLNRSFARGTKNKFPISQNLPSINSEIALMKSLGRYLTLEERADLPLIHFLSKLPSNMSRLSNLSSMVLQSNLTISPPEDIYESQGGSLEFHQIIDVHDESTPILFRHFADILVRLSLLRSSDPEAVHYELEDIIENKLKPIFQEKKKEKPQLRTSNTSSKIHLDDEISVLTIKVQVLLNAQQVKVRETVRSLFNLLKKSNKTSRFGFLDETCYLKDLIKCLQYSNVLKSSEELMPLSTSIIEQSFDVQWTFGQLETQCREHDKEREREQAKVQSRRISKLQAATSTAGQSQRKISPDFKRLRQERLTRIVNAELIPFEFERITIMLLIKAVRETSSKIDDETLASKVCQLADRIIASIRQSELTSRGTAHKLQPTPKMWPSSIKDEMKVDLSRLKIRKAEADKERRRRDDERKREQRERAQMQLQDIDIPSDIENDDEEDYDY